MPTETPRRRPAPEPAEVRDPEPSAAEARRAVLETMSAADRDRVLGVERSRAPASRAPASSSRSRSRAR